MHDSVLNRALRLAVVGTISIAALISLILCYQALFDGITGSWSDAAGKCIWGTLAGTAALLMIRYRTDLIDT